MTYDKEVLQVFIEQQYRMFSEPVVESMRETQEFLEENMAVVVNSVKEIRDYFEQSGTDISGMSDEELLEQSEIFELKKTNRYLIVEI